MYAAIWIPQLALQSVLRTEAFPGNACVALLRETAQRSIIYQVNSFAARYGVTEGQTVSQAVAKCKELQVRPRKPLAEKAAKATLFNCIYTLTPLIEETFEDLYTIQLRGLNATTLQEQIHELLLQLKKQGFFPQIGVAETPDWANYAARCADPLLWIKDTHTMFQAISIHTAVDDPSLKAILKQWGVHSLADFAKLPQQAIAERLGRAGLEIWRSLHNKNQRILRIKTPPVEFKSCIELEFEIETLDPLLFVLNRIIDQLCMQLKSAFLKAQVLILQLTLDDKSNYRRIFKLPEPTLQKEKLAQVLHTHLENLQTSTAITSVALEMVPTEAADHQSQLFQHQVKDPWKFNTTIHQLIGLVGSENVGTPLLKDSHEPDAFSMMALTQTLEPPPEDDASSLFQLRQLHLQRYRPPKPAKVILKDRTPIILQVVSSREDESKISGNILSVRGPWHLSGSWWDQRYWKRMEWDVQLENGSLLRLVYSRQKWFIEGAYG